MGLLEPDAESLHHRLLKASEYCPGRLINLENAMRDFRLNAPAAAILLSLAMLSACDAPQTNAEDTSADVATDATVQEGMAITEPAATGVVVPAGIDASDLRTQTQITASGNEPFWSVVVDGGTLTYKTPERISGATFEAERTQTADGVRFSGAHDGSEFVLELRDVPCRDSMSGAMFDFTASVTVGGRTMTGCARRTSDPVEPA